MNATRPIHTLFLLLPLLLLTQPPAQAEPAATEKIYQVDILLFERPLSHDRFPARKPAAADYSQARPLQPAETTAEPVLLPPMNPEPGHPPFWQQLPEKDQGLQQAAHRLEHSPRYAVLARFSWIQPAAPRRAQQPVRLQPPAPEEKVEDALLTLDFPSATTMDAGDPSPPRLDGQASLYRGSYLHLKLDLRYCKPASPRSLGLEPDCWRLQQDYRVQPGKLYYYDHRHFGALAQIRLLNDASSTAPDTDR